MTKELLTADASEIAGLGDLLDRIGGDTLASHRFLLDHAGLGENVVGQILKRLQPYLARFQEMTRTRQVHLSVNCGEMGAELNKAAQIDWPAEWPTPNTEDEVESQPYRIPWE